MEITSGCCEGTAHDLPRQSWVDDWAVGVPRPTSGVATSITAKPVKDSTLSWRSSCFVWEACWNKDCDWAAELRKPAREKGVRYADDGGNAQVIRVRVMEWFSLDEKWYGRWKWIPWSWESDWPWYSRARLARRKRAMDAWRAISIPTEILLSIIEHVVSVNTPDEDLVRAALDDGTEDQLMRRHSCEPGFDHLCSLALVCRTWYTGLAPLLYGRLHATESRINDRLRASTAQLARTVKIRGGRLFSTSANLGRQLPNVVAMAWFGIDSNGNRIRGPTYSPAQARIYADVHSSFSHLLHLELWRCDFLSFSDLLRLLASFPALVHVSLAHVSVAHVSSTVVAASLRPRHLQRISVDYDTLPHRLTGSLASVCVWGLHPCQNVPYGFAGIPRSEAQVILDLHDAIIPDHCAYKKLAVDSVDSGKTCTSQLLGFCACSCLTSNRRSLV